MYIKSIILSTLARDFCKFCSLNSSLPFDCMWYIMYASVVQLRQFYPDSASFTLSKVFSCTYENIRKLQSTVINKFYIQIEWKKKRILCLFFLVFFKHISGKCWTLYPLYKWRRHQRFSFSFSLILLTACELKLVYKNSADFLYVGN